MKPVWISSVSLLALLFVGCTTTSNLEVVDNFIAEKYMGTWYEVVRYPHHFEAGLSSVSATYTLNDDKSITVLNRGYNEKKGEWESVTGKAKFKGPEDQGWLKVSFFGPFYASYKIVYLNGTYTEAIIAGPNYNYLWILVRDPNTSKERIDRLMEKAINLGYKKSAMIRVKHDAEVK